MKALRGSEKHRNGCNGAVEPVNRRHFQVVV